MFEKYLKVEGFTAFPKSNNKYFLNNEGEIKLADGTLVECGKDINGHRRIFADLWDGVRFYYLKDLIAICFKSIHLPIELWKEVDGFHIDDNLDNLRSSNIGYRFRSNKLECINHPGYYYIPMFTKYAINKHGQIITVNNGYNKTWYTTKYQKKKNIKGGYYITRATSDILNSTILSRHRAMCLVFKSYPNNVDKLDVNHIDGVPGNDTLDNLEWVTRSRNNTHAYQNNLKNQNHPVLVRDVITGEVTEYYSVCECARALGFTCDEVIRYRLLSADFSKVWGDGKQLKYKEDTRDWIIPKDPQQAISDGAKLRPIRVRNCYTRKETMYNSISDAEKDINVNRATIAFNIDNGLTKPHKGYQFKDIDDTTVWGDFTQDELMARDRIAKTVMGRNLLTGEVCEYSSIRECYSKQGKPTNLQITMRNGKQRVFPDGWQYKFSDEDWREIGDLDTEMLDCVTEIMARNIQTGQLYIAGSAREMAANLNLDSKLVGKAIREGPEKVYGLHQFRLGLSNNPWPKIPEMDIAVLSIGTSPSGVYYKFVHKENGESVFYRSVEDCLKRLETVNSRAVFFRQIKTGKLMDGIWKVTRYRPKCLLS